MPALVPILLLARLLAHPQDGPDVDVRVHVEDTRVVFQIMMNLAFVDEIVTVPRERPDALHDVELPALKKALVSFYEKNNRVRIDGVTVLPKVTEFERPPPELHQLPRFPNYGMRAIIKLRLELEYETTSPPHEVAMKWGPFPLNPANPDVPGGDPQPLDVTAQIFAQGESQVILFMQELPEHVWERVSDDELTDRFLSVPAPMATPTLSVPVVSMGIVGALLSIGAILLVIGGVRSRGYRRAVIGGLLVAGCTWPFFHFEVDDPFSARALPDEAEALGVFRPLHGNIYKAFDFTSESEIYDALERSVHGDLLESLYGEVYHSLIMQDEGGAVSHVTEVRWLETEVEDVGAMVGAHVGFQVKVRWQVDGEVRHWGHAHYRTNEYRARYSVVRTGDGWRIAGHHPLGSKRIGASVPERRQPPGSDGK